MNSIQQYSTQTALRN